MASFHPLLSLSRTNLKSISVHWMKGTVSNARREENLQHPSVARRDSWSEYFRIFNLRKRWSLISSINCLLHEWNPSSFGLLVLIHIRSSWLCFVAHRCIGTGQRGFEIRADDVFSSERMSERQHSLSDQLNRWQGLECELSLELPLKSRVLGGRKLQTIANLFSWWTTGRKSKKNNDRRTCQTDCLPHTWTSASIDAWGSRHSLQSKRRFLRSNEDRSNHSWIVLPRSRARYRQSPENESD